MPKQCFRDAFISVFIRVSYKAIKICYPWHAVFLLWNAWVYLKRRVYNYNEWYQSFGYTVIYTSIIWYWHHYSTNVPFKYPMNLNWLIRLCLGRHSSSKFLLFGLIFFLYSTTVLNFIVYANDFCLGKFQKFLLHVHK